MNITTLVPAYKPKYLVELLTALRHQTVKPARVLFSDDSPGLEFTRLLDSEPIRPLVAELNIEVVEGPHTGGWPNFLHLLEVWGGRTELFHFLLDDDLIYPTFYERHLAAHQGADTLCSVSRRWTALENGQPLRDLGLPDAVARHPHRLLSLPADILFATTVARSANWLGEYSNAVFRAEFAPEVRATAMDGISYIGLEDLGAFLCASLVKPLAYVNETLGSFRMNAEQHSAKPMGRAMKMAHLAYLALAIAARRLGRLSEAECRMVMKSLCPLVAQRYGGEADMAEFSALMPAMAEGGLDAEREFLDLWRVRSTQ